MTHERSWAIVVVGFAVGMALVMLQVIATMRVLYDTDYKVQENGLYLDLAIKKHQ